MSISGITSNYKKLLHRGRWVTADLHVHSIYSDGGFSPCQILNYAAGHFLDAVAIADHFEVRGGLEGRTLSENNPDLPIAIPAQEVSAGNRFHFLLINSQETHAEFTRSELLHNLEEHKRGGGAVILAHPWTMPNNKWARSSLQDLITAGLVDGIELFNSSSLEMADNRQIWRRIWEEWVAPNKLAVTGGSDFHHLHKGRYIGTGRTYLKVNSPGEVGIIEALRAGKCVAGLFGNQVDKEGTLISNGLLWGQEPWVTELQRLRENIRKKLACFRFSPAYRRLLMTLYEAGHYQYILDLMEAQ